MKFYAVELGPQYVNLVLEIVGWHIRGFRQISELEVVLLNHSRILRERNIMVD